MKRSHIALLAVLTLVSCCPMTVATATAAITFEAIPEDSPCAWDDCLKEHRKCREAARSDKIHFCDLALENCKEQCAAPIPSLITHDATTDDFSLVEVPVAFGLRAFNPENFVFGEGTNTITIKLTDGCHSNKSLRREVVNMFTPNKASRLFSALLSPRELATLLGPGYFIAPTTNGRTLVAHRRRLVEVAPNRRESTGSMIWLRGARPVPSDQSVEEILRLIRDSSRTAPGLELEVAGLEMQLKRSTIQGTVSTLFHWLADFGIIQVSNDGINGIVELIISILERFGVEVSTESITETVRELVASSTRCDR